MADREDVVSRVRVLAITHILVGALFIILGLADGVTSVLDTDYMFDAGFGFFAFWTGTWMCIAGGLGIPGSTPQRTQRRNCFAGIFMGFSITSAVFGGIIIIMYSTTIAGASCCMYCDDLDYSLPRPKYSYDTKMGLTAVILTLGIIEFGTGIWVSICLCVMKSCCTELEEHEPLVHSVG